MLVKEAVERMRGRRPRFGDLEDLHALELLALYDRALEACKRRRGRNTQIPEGHKQHLLNSDEHELRRLV
jgi:hypothetical protein